MNKVHAAVYNKQVFVTFEQIQHIIKLKMKKKTQG
jgi:hypothetical protein